jgi:histidine triad (HIT) family protein
MIKDCIFCKIANGEIPEERIYENDNFFSIHDAKPKTKGHALVISKKHFENSLELPNTLGVELLDCIKNTMIKSIEENKSEGFNIISNNFEAAGQVIKHMHFHVLPRKKGDEFFIPEEFK